MWLQFIIFILETVIPDRVILSADKLSIECVPKMSETVSFHDVHFKTYFCLDLEILQSQSCSFHLHIK